MKRAIHVGLVLAAAAGHASSQSFNIDVGENGGAPPSSYAGAGQAGFWNSVRADHVTPFTTGPTAQDVMLVDIHGNQTSVGFHQYGGMDLVSADDPSVNGNDALLLDDYLATHSLTLESCMYLNGLENGSYEVITYAWMPNDPSTQQNVRFDFHPGSDPVGGTWTGAHVEGVTYSRRVVDVTNGNIGLHVGIPSGGQTFPGAAFNGWQVTKLGTPVPALPACGIVGLVVAVGLGGAVILLRARPAAG
jgi:hypothetical protein